MTKIKKEEIERDRERERGEKGRKEEERKDERRRNEIALYIEIGLIVKTFKFRVKLSFYDMIEIEIGT